MPPSKLPFYHRNKRKLHGHSNSSKLSLATIVFIGTSLSFAILIISYLHLATAGQGQGQGLYNNNWWSDSTGSHSNTATTLDGTHPLVSSSELSTKRTVPSEEISRKEGHHQHRHHQCLNSDFQPQHRVAIWTMLNDNMAYTLGAAKIGRGIQRHTQTPHDLVVMEIQSKPLGPEHWEKLSKIGFKRCVVESIPPPKKTRPDLKEKFAVLHVWDMTVYDTVLFIDADTFVQNSLDDLLHMDLQGKTIGVTKDIRARKWVDTFNSGVLLLHPNATEYQRLVNLLKTDGFVFDYVMSDQGFLNEVYKDDWHEIGFLNNANLALYRFQREFWDKHNVKDINIIHYTMQKPWKCKPTGPYGPICLIWINADE